MRAHPGPLTRIPRTAVAVVAIAAVTLIGGCGSSSDSGAAASSSPAADGTCVSGKDASIGGAGNYVHVTGALGAAPVIQAVCSAPAPSGLISFDIAAGAGAPAAVGSRVTVHYTGYGMTTRKVFDSSWNTGSPLPLSLKQVIAGWSQGIPGMKPGGRRVLVIPGSMAYGDMPPPGIEVNETLVFVVDLVSSP